MSELGAEQLFHWFDGGGSSRALLLGHDLDERLDAWHALRGAMARSMPEGFRREEWAYLLTFVDRNSLAGLLERSFGRRVESPGPSPRTITRPRGSVAVWLPGNVSLLGPLTLVLLGVVGTPVRMKSSSTADDLCGAFRTWALDRVEDASLRSWLDEQVLIEEFDRSDPRSAEMAATAAVRVVFGSDEAVAAIDALAHPTDSVGVAFADRRSEAWADPAAARSPEVAATLAQVRAVYGAAGCTSPQRLVVVGGTPDDAATAAALVADAWPVGDVAMHQATGSVAAAQVASARGYETRRLPRGAGVVAVGPIDAAPLDDVDVLAVTWADEATASASLPANIQTIGVASPTGWRPSLALLHAAGRWPKRIVDLTRMHHFGALWDGYDIWRSLTEDLDVA